MKKGLVVLVLCVSALGLAGCQTAKGVTTGMALTVQGAAQDVGVGGGGLWGALNKFDQWIRDNMW